MSDRYPFRHMRLTMKLCQAQVYLMLGVKEFAFEQKEYVMFNVMANMVNQFDNPTHKQYLAALAAWLRFETRLIAKLPVGETQDKVQAEFDKLTMDYKDLLEEKAK